MTDNNTGKVISVIIPVYNQAQELRAALASLSRQTYMPFEVIIVNDGSTDQTAQVIEELKWRFWKKKIRAKIISQSNQGAPAARNRGLKEAKGSYVIFWDADVVAHPHLLTKMQATLANTPDASYAYSSFIFGKKKFTLWPFDGEKLKKMPYIHSTSLIRRDHFPKQGWDITIKRLQDWDVWLTMLQAGHVGVWVPEVLFSISTQHGTMSQWLPTWAYKLPWLKKVKRYNEAVEVIKKKHLL